MDLSRRRLFGALLGASSSLAVVPSLLARGVADPQPKMPASPPLRPPKSLVPGALDLFAQHFGWRASPILPEEAIYQFDHPFDHPVRQLSIGVRAPSRLATPWEFQKFHTDLLVAMANLGSTARAFASQEPKLHFIRLPEPSGLLETEVVENQHQHSMRVIKHYDMCTDEFQFRFDVAILNYSGMMNHSPPGRRLLFV